MLDVGWFYIHELYVMSYLIYILVISLQLAIKVRRLILRTNPYISLATIGNILRYPFEGKRRKRRQRMSWSDSVIDAINMYLDKFQDTVEDKEAWCAMVHGVKKSQT